MKKFLSILLTLLMLCSVVTGTGITVNGAESTVSGTSVTSGDFEYEALDETTAEITGYVGSDAEVTIPTTLDGYTVVSIGYDAFYECTNLTSVTIPDSVTSIGKYAFIWCTELTSVTIGDSVTSIGYGAFSGCTSLTSITIPESVTSISNCAFEECTGLTFITVDENNTVYDSRDNCNGIIETATNTLIIGCCNTIIPDSITSIGEDAFSGCTDMTTVTIPDSVTSIAEYAFYNCIGLTSITIPDSVTSIGESAFEVCTDLASITVDENNTVYDSRNNCNAIIETATNTLIIGCCNTIIPDSVTSIGNYAFGYRTSLTNITIPASVTSIGNYAFVWCEGLTSITIPDSVTSIGSYAFRGCTSLTSITIPASVTSIGDYAFAWCTGLTSITIGDSVTSIGECAFYECTGLTSITIPDSVTSIGEDAFSGCTGLRSVTIPDSVTSICNYAFCECTELTSITMGDSVTSIGEGAFYDCTGLTSVTIPASVTSIGDYAFYGCDNLVMYGYDGSYAQTYAEENEIAFELISEEENTVTIKFAVPNTLESKKWHSWNGVDLAYGDRGSWKELTRIEMTATGETYTSNGVEGSQYLEAGEWAIYSVTLTSDQIEALEDAKYVVFINGTNYHRTTLLQKYNVFKGTTVADLNGAMYVIDSIDTTRSCELDSYLGSWVFA